MKACPRCHFSNLDTRDQCLKCGALLDHREVAPPQPRRFDLSGFRRPVLRLWDRLTASLRVPLPTGVTRRRPATATTLGLVPGLGQLYNRQPRKAVHFLLAWVGLLALAIWRFTDPIWAYPTLLAWIAMWIWSMNDGLVTAIRINGQPWVSHQSWGTAFAITTMLAATWFVAMFFLSPFVYFRMIGNDTFAPLFREGDFIWLDKWCLWFGGELRRGEHIYYDPTGFTMHQGSDAIFYDAQNFIERVIGLPGETVLMTNQGGVCEITVNGVPLDPELYPISTEFLPHHRVFQVPRDRWLILQSMTMQEGFLERVMGASHAGTLAGADITDTHWTDSCYVSRDQMIGRVFAIGHPPGRRRWFSRGEQE
jgi:signal peptidase I/TM2 domain-containing membrane protein YozV